MWLLIAGMLLLLCGVVFYLVFAVKKITKKSTGKTLIIANVLCIIAVVMLLIFIALDDINAALLALTVLMLLSALVCMIISIVNRCKGKEHIKIRLIALAMVLLAMVLFIVASGIPLTSALFILGLVCVIATVIMFAAEIFKKKENRKKKSKYLIMGMAVISVTLIVVGNALSEREFNARLQNHEAYEVSIKTDYDFEVEDGEEPVEIVTSKGFDDNYALSHYLNVYDSADNALILTKTGVTANMCINAVKNSDNIDDYFKPYFIDFIKRIAKQYPEANLDVLYNNLKTLKVEVLNKNDYIIKSMSVTSLGCYHMPDNTIYIPEGNEYVEGEWGFQVLIHEFCHAARTSWFEGKEGKECRLEFNSENANKLLMESMNSVFSCSLLNYYEWDIAYQVPSNYLRIMLECMDNYELEDYINHSDMYFLSKLDEYAGYTNYAQVIWKLIALQRSDWEDDTTDIDYKEYYPIYEFLCDLYYEKYITSDMSEEECTAVADNLVYKAFFDAPEGYKTDESFFYDYLTTWRAENIA